MLRFLVAGIAAPTPTVHVLFPCLKYETAGIVSTQLRVQEWEDVLKVFEAPTAAMIWKHHSCNSGHGGLRKPVCGHRG